jgi:hypothetical protein
MKLCPHCGQSLEEDAARCRKCGGWVVGKKRSFSTGRKKRPGTRRLLIIVGLAALAWAVSSLPGNTIDPRELLELQPAPSDILDGMRSELETIIDLQEAYYRDHGVYSGNPSGLGFRAPEGFRVSLLATPAGWSAAVTHIDHPADFGCAVFEGAARPPPTPVRPTVPGRVECSSGGG